jgi:hypothetical protein
VEDEPSRPRRVRLSRRRGWRKPDGVLVVARPSRWGNPHRIGDAHPVTGRPMTRAEAVELYERDLLADELPDVRLSDVRRELAGRDLACWCPLDGPCHADVLLRAANG